MEWRPIELFVPEIKQVLHKKAFADLKHLLLEINPIDLADGFGEFIPEEQVLLLRLLPPNRIMEVFEELDVPQQEYIVSHLDDNCLTPLMGDTSPALFPRLFKKLPFTMVKRMTSLMKMERMEGGTEVKQYPANTAGAIMKRNFIAVGPDTTAKATLSLLQARSRVRVEEEIHMIFVTHPDRRLLGGVSLRTLIAAPANIKMKEIMSPMAPIRIPVMTDREDAAKIFSRYKTISTPVIDQEGRLVGVLDAEDVIQVMEQESTEDIQKLAGVQALELPYFQTSLREMIKKRATWLCVLFLGETLTATAMGFFEHELAKAVVLAMFIPLIISSGGNSGSQAATLIVRAIALKEVSFQDWWRVMRREFISGLALGSILGFLGFSGIVFWSQFTTMYGPHYWLVALAVSLTLILVVLWGSLAGSLLPIALKRLGLDPAVASTPFVATLVDVTGLIIYFSIGLLVLKGTLL